MEKRKISDETRKNAFFIAGRIIERYADLSGNDNTMLMLARLMKVADSNLYPLIAGIAKYHPALICRLNAKKAGNRICQDWPIEDVDRPEIVFNPEERDDLEYNHQIENSRLADYDKGLDFFHDEMSVSFTIADFLDDIELRRLP